MRTALMSMAFALALVGAACDSSPRSTEGNRPVIGSSTGSGPGTPANGGPDAMGRSGGGPNS